MNLLISQILITDIVTLFRPSDKTGVDPASAAAQAEQAEKLRLAEEKEKREKRARDKVLAANQGRRGRGTLFQQSAETGVPKEKLGA